MAPTLDDYLNESDTYDADEVDSIPTERRAEIDEKIDEAHSS